MKLGDLKGNPRNPRRITDQEKAQLKASLDYFGDLGGIFFNIRTQRLGGGHQRGGVLPAESEVVVERRYDTPTRTGTVAEGYVLVDGERFSYREVDWPSDKEEAANVAANRLGGEDDEEKLGQILADLDDDLRKLAGVTDEEMDRLAGTPPEGDPDAVPEPPKVAKTKRGEMWLLGSHRVLCGDATDRADVERLMAGQKADVTFTSPPYNAAKESFLNGRVAGFENKYANAPDAMTDADYLALLTGATDLALAHSRFVFVNLQLLAHNRVALADYWHCYRDRTKDVLVWDKSQAPPNIVPGAFNTKFEFIFCFSDDAKTRGFPVEWRGQHPNVVTTVSNSGNEFADQHRAGFPVALPAWFLEKLPFARLVFEPFAGTGTTIIAAEALRRRCFGMEIEPLYCDVILQRFAAFASIDPVREDGVRWSELR